MSAKQNPLGLTFFRPNYASKIIDWAGDWDQLFAWTIQFGVHVKLVEQTGPAGHPTIQVVGNEIGVKNFLAKYNSHNEPEKKAKTKTIRVIVIDPFKKEITEDHIEPILKEFYRLIGCEYIEAALVSRLRDSNFLYVDEEGFLKNNQEAFQIGNLRPILGRAILLKNNGRGSETSTTYTIDQVKELVTFF